MSLFKTIFQNLGPCHLKISDGYIAEENPQTYLFLGNPPFLFSLPLPGCSLGKSSLPRKPLVERLAIADPRNEKMYFKNQKIKYFSSTEGERNGTCSC